jgi:CRISPR-associated protein Csm3
MYAKLKITGQILVKTGLHIGGSDAFSAIGAVDSTVIRDPWTAKPIIPGSSLKGKMRTLLARSLDNILLNPQNCESDRVEILRLFGRSSGKKETKNLHPDKKEASEEDTKTYYSHLQFFDCFLINGDGFKKRELDVTEIKFENTINRLTAVANPRQIERVVNNAIFSFNLTYEMDDPNLVEKDFSLIYQGMKLLELDYLGGHGTRGYGRIKFRELKIEKAFGEVEQGIIEKLQRIFQE